MEHLEGLLRLADREFAEMEQNGKFRNKEDVEIAYKLIDIVKDVYQVWDCEDKMGDGYSEYGRSYPMNMNDMSYARRRNSMGRFMSNNDDYRMSRENNYSRTDAKQEYLEYLRNKMNNSSDSLMRDRIQNMIRDVEQM